MPIVKKNAHVFTLDQWARPLRRGQSVWVEFTLDTMAMAYDIRITLSSGNVTYLFKTNYECGVVADNDWAYLRATLEAL